MSVRRTRRLPLEQLQPYLLDVSQSHANEPVPPVPLDWRAVFGNDRGVVVEVGFGKGLFLLSAGQAHAGTNYLGIEIERKYQLFTATRLAKRGLSNVRLACADARCFFRDFIAAGTLEAIHVYFPDPWWKHRHRKRRVFNEEFVTQCARCLRPCGRLHVVSDVADYYEDIVELMAGCAELRPEPEMPEQQQGQDYLTNFERKYRLEDRPIHRAVYERQ
jgi:tRNA (guanine-N7-)-methyltransferase